MVAVHEFGGGVEIVCGSGWPSRFGKARCVRGHGWVRRATGLIALVLWWPMRSSLYTEGKLVVWRTRAGGQTPSEFKCGFGMQMSSFCQIFFGWFPSGPSPPQAAQAHTPPEFHIWSDGGNFYWIWVACAQIRAHNHHFGRFQLLL